MESPIISVPEPGRDPYTHFAAAYASSAETNFSGRMAEWVLSYVAEGGFTAPLRIIDLACGVGVAAVIFARQGHYVLGVDSSNTMLDEARKLSKRHGLNIAFEQQDMRELHIHDPGDVVTCMYDALNFMTSISDLSLVFNRVAAALRIGGLFVFDMYTPKGLEKAWGSCCQIHTNLDNFFVVTETKWDAETTSDLKTLYGFNRLHNKWHHWIEKHLIRAYPVSVIRRELKRQGFRVLYEREWTNQGTKPLTSRTTRLLIVAART